METKEMSSVFTSHSKLLKHEVKHDQFNFSFLLIYAN